MYAKRKMCYNITTNRRYNKQDRVSADGILLMYYKVFDEKNFRCYNFNVGFLQTLCDKDD